LLPPKGHELNSAEYINCWLQDFCDAWQPPHKPVDEYDHFIRGPTTFKELEQALSDGVEYFNKNEPEEKISGYYRNRATDRALLERWDSSKVVEAVREIREESGGQSFKFPIRI
jgi:hypothetical protein